MMPYVSEYEPSKYVRRKEVPSPPKFWLRAKDYRRETADFVDGSWVMADVAADPWTEEKSGDMPSSNPYSNDVSEDNIEFMPNPLKDYESMPASMGGKRYVKPYFFKIPCEDFATVDSLTQSFLERIPPTLYGRAHSFRTWSFTRPYHGVYVIVYALSDPVHKLVNDSEVIALLMAPEWVWSYRNTLGQALSGLFNVFVSFKRVKLNKVARPSQKCYNHPKSTRSSSVNVETRFTVRLQQE